MYNLKYFTETAEKLKNFKHDFVYDIHSLGNLNFRSELLYKRMCAVFDCSFSHCVSILTLSLLSASFLRKKINHFFLKMHQIWHMSFCMTILTRKFNKIFLLTLSYKNSCVKFDAVSRRNGSFFSSKTRCCEKKVLNIIIGPIKNIFDNIDNCHDI